MTKPSTHGIKIKIVYSKRTVCNRHNETRKRQNFKMFEIKRVGNTEKKSRRARLFSAEAEISYLYKQIQSIQTHNRDKQDLTANMTPS